MDSHVTTDKPYLVTMGHAPLNTTVLSPKTFDPLSSPRKLIKYIRKHPNAVVREVHCLDEADWQAVLAAFTVPHASLYFHKVEEKRRDGLMTKQVYWYASCKG